MLLSFLLSEVKYEWNLTSDEEATVGSVVFLGMMFGSYLWGIISDRYGRRFGYLATAIFTGVFGILSAMAPNYSWLLILRTLVGFGLGGAPVAFSLFAEFLPNKTRGISLILIEIFWTIGTVLGAGLAWFALIKNFFNV